MEIMLYIKKIPETSVQIRYEHTLRTTSTENENKEINSSVLIKSGMILLSNISFDSISIIRLTQANHEFVLEEGKNELLGL